MKKRILLVTALILGVVLTCTHLIGNQKKGVQQKTATSLRVENSSTKKAVKTVAQTAEATKKVTKEEVANAAVARKKAASQASVEFIKTDAVQEETKPTQTNRVLVELTASPAYTQFLDNNKAPLAEKNAAEHKVILAQKGVQKQAEKITGHKVEDTFGYLQNAFAIIATDEDIAKLEKIEGVKSVQREKIHERAEMSTNEALNAPGVWSYNQDGKSVGLKGEKIVVSVIDTGLDSTHPDFRLTDDQNVALSKETIEKDIQTLGYGIYSTAKVPFQYNYADNVSAKDYVKDHEIAHQHGQHVGGIIGANTDLSKTGDGVTGVVGVAPEVQLLGMKVFSDTGASGSDGTVTKAIEDSVKLGADVINMSMGAQDVGLEDSFLEKSTQAACEAGVLTVVAAGNSGRTNGVLGSIGNSNSEELYPVKNVSTIGDPGAVRDALSVASENNKKIISEVLKVKVEGGETKEIPIRSNTLYKHKENYEEYKDYFNTPTDFVVLPDLIGGKQVSATDFETLAYLSDYPENTAKEKMPYMQAGCPGFANYTNLYGFAGITNDKTPPYEVKEKLQATYGNKFIVCTWHELGRPSMAENIAKLAGAKGVIQIIKQTGSIDMYPVEVLHGEDNLRPEVLNQTVPMFLAHQEDFKPIFTDLGLDVNKKFTAEEVAHISKKVTLTDGGIKEIDNPTYKVVKMSDFSSWGLPDSLAVKPEITGIGGNVYSTQNVDENGVAQFMNLSGTSMATPSIAGAGALLIQHLKANTNLKGIDLVRHAKTMLENTASPVIENNGRPASVRHQGSGLANIEKAIKTSVVVTDEKDSDGIVDLREVKSNQKTFTLNVQNLSNQEQTFTWSNLGAFTEKISLTDDFFATWRGWRAPISQLEHKVFFDVYQPEEVTANGVEIQGTREIKVPKNGSTKVSFTINFADSVSKNQFVEGYLQFHEKGKEAVVISVPYCGYYGSITDEGNPKAQTVVDKSFGEEGSVYENGFFSTQDGYLVGAKDTEKVVADQTNGSQIKLKTLVSGKRYFSPTPDGDTIEPVGIKLNYTQLQNSQGDTVDVIDAKTGKTLQRILTGTLAEASGNSSLGNGDYSTDYYRFNIYDSIRESNNFLLPVDKQSNIGEKYYPDGDYIFRLTSHPATHPNQSQVVDYPISLDRTAPVITNSTAKFEPSEELATDGENPAKGTQIGEALVWTFESKDNSVNTSKNKIVSFSNGQAGPSRKQLSVSVYPWQVQTKKLSNGNYLYKIVIPKKYTLTSKLDQHLTTLEMEVYDDARNHATATGEVTYDSANFYLDKLPSKTSVQDGATWKDVYSYDLNNRSLDYNPNIVLSDGITDDNNFVITGYSENEFYINYNVIGDATRHHDKVTPVHDEGKPDNDKWHYEFKTSEKSYDAVTITKDADEKDFLYVNPFTIENNLITNNSFSEYTKYTDKPGNEQGNILAVYNNDTEMMMKVNPYIVDPLDDETAAPTVHVKVALTVDWTKDLDLAKAGYIYNKELGERVSNPNPPADKSYQKSRLFPAYLKLKEGETETDAKFADQVQITHDSDGNAYLERDVPVCRGVNTIAVYLYKKDLTGSIFAVQKEVGNFMYTGKNCYDAARDAGGTVTRNVLDTLETYSYEADVFIKNSKAFFAYTDLDQKAAAQEIKAWQQLSESEKNAQRKQGNIDPILPYHYNKEHPEESTYTITALLTDTIDKISVATNYEATEAGSGKDGMENITIQKLPDNGYLSKTGNRYNQYIRFDVKAGVLSTQPLYFKVDAMIGGEHKESVHGGDAVSFDFARNTVSFDGMYNALTNPSQLVSEEMSPNASTLVDTMRPIYTNQLSTLLKGTLSSWEAGSLVTFNGNQLYNDGYTTPDTTPFGSDIAGIFHGRKIPTHALTTTLSLHEGENNIQTGIYSIVGYRQFFNTKVYAHAATLSKPVVSLNGNTATLTSQDKDVTLYAKRSTTGKVVAVPSGTQVALKVNETIEVYAKDIYGNVSPKVKVTYKNKPAVTKVVRKSVYSTKLLQGKSKALKVSVYAKKGADTTVTWTSSNNSIATVSSKGVVTARQHGTAIITAHAGNKSVTFKVTVAGKKTYVTKEKPTLKTVASTLKVSLNDLKSWNPKISKTAFLKKGTKIVYYK